MKFGEGGPTSGHHLKRESTMKNFLFLKRFLRPRKAKMIPIKSGIFKGQKHIEPSE
jgi:hypothetical protein